ncbi:hypothetical protein FXF51_55450 [Nonomuraea sp. PA05]|uniref:hypothetical protein n=1 Tax=Nonomuraea sp. PA05 TaxID=2604466 RepID=UPI0011D5AB8D|nr:hypothetical protein [Nonomuraea sp. PA05]TYB50708.1 hypothetical protein FXF51_55450 [Nonomuraea sp. PA05]
MLTWSVHPALGGVVIALEVFVVVVILGTALFGSEVISERAFRVMRWALDRPEPKSPLRLPAAED